MSVLTGVQDRLTLIASEDPQLRAFIRVDVEDALSAAVAADARRSSHTSLSPLDGLAVAVKDNLAVKGKPWTAGVSGRRGVIADADATAVARLRAAGAVLVGSTNMDEAALGAVTDNPAFGRCANPLGSGLTPGGSSGGSAVAVAAGFSDLALGTDTMGSIRVPAAYCGIAGIKPTTGAIDRGGLAMLCPTLDTIGPMARDVALLWPALEVLGSAEALERWLPAPPSTDFSSIRFGVPVQLKSVDCAASVLGGLRRAVDIISRLGGTVVEIDLADWNPHQARRAGLLIVEAEGARELADLLDRPGAITDHLRSMLTFGREASDEKLASARSMISDAARSVDVALTEVDALLMPTAPQRAFRHGDAPPPNQADLTALANFSGCPALALPVTCAGETLPASVQLIGRHWSEPDLLSWAGLLFKSLSVS